VLYLFYFDARKCRKQYLEKSVLKKISPQKNQSNPRQNPARTFPGGNTRAVTTLSAGLGFLEASLDPEMESGSKLDSDPETESGSVSLIAINFLLVLLSLSFYRSTVLQFSPSSQKEITVLPGADQLGRVQGEPSLDSPWRSRRNFVGFNTI
jgi:hypothetical protein